MLLMQVVGHLKTVFILAGGCFFFGDEMPLKKFCGIALAMTGIVWCVSPADRLQLPQAKNSKLPADCTGLCALNPQAEIVKLQPLTVLALCLSSAVK